MGHIHLGVLPGTRRWREVVELLAQGAVDEQVIAQAAIAAERDLGRAANDPVFVEAVRLLAMIPVAARSGSLSGALSPSVSSRGDTPDLFSLLAAIGNHLDRVADTRSRRTDFAELARRALLATLSEQIGGRLPGLFEATTEDVRAAAASLAQPGAFSNCARGFFRRLLAESLRYWLDRGLARHTGPGGRFADAGERSAFDEALTQYCFEATFIMKEFAAGWFNRTLEREGAIASAHAAAFGAIAFRKIVEELQIKRSAR